MGNFSMLPFDIMLQILSRLPIETAFNCKVVSKPWRDVIQHPSFSEMHLNKLNSSGQFSFLTKLPFHESNLFSDVYNYIEYDKNLNCFIRKLTIRFTFPFRDGCGILGSCDGLICFHAFSLDRDKTDSSDQPINEPAYICNPVTKEYVVLPEFEGKDLLYGFGYVPSTNEYKVVRICNYRNSRDYRNRRDPNFGIVQIYTLGSGIGWRNAKKNMDDDVMGNYIPCQSGVFANGALFWMDSRGIIGAFDLADEEFRKLPSPPCPIFYIEILVVDDYLCARILCSPKGIQVFDLWVLKNYKNSHDVCIWDKWFRNLAPYDKPITFTKSGDLLCRNTGDDKAYLYARQASSSRKLVNIGENFGSAIPHKNTLVSLKALGEEDTKLMDSGERSSTRRTRNQYREDLERRRRRYEVWISR